jgi:hypothetical protein
MRTRLHAIAGYFKDDKYSETPLLPILRSVLEGVFTQESNSSLGPNKNE